MDEERSNLSYIIAGVLAFILVVILVLGCTYLNKKMGIPDDNPIEEFFEDVVEEKIGLPSGAIDFTPGTKEHRT